jgi:hypothetical protein
MLMSQTSAAKKLQEDFEQAQRNVEIRLLERKVALLGAMLIDQGLVHRTRVLINDQCDHVYVVIDLRSSSYYSDISHLLGRETCVRNSKDRKQLIYDISLTLALNKVSLRNNFFYNHSEKKIVMLLERPVVVDAFIKKWQSIPACQGKMVEKELYAHLANLANAENPQEYKEIKETIENKLKPVSFKNSLYFLGISATPSLGRKTILPIENHIPSSFRATK